MKQRDEYQSHPSFGMIVSTRTSHSPPGKALFDSDTRHQHYVTIRIHHADRRRDLHRDWIMAREQIIEIAMSEAQFASFMSSPNTSGVPCTIEWLDGDVEGLPFSPRLEESMKETRAAADVAFGDILAALQTYEDTPASPAKAKREALSKLRSTINNAVPNVVFAGQSLSEHAENVVQRARADIEAMVAQHAAQLGIEAPETALLEQAPDTEGGSK